MEKVSKEGGKSRVLSSGGVDLLWRCEKMLQGRIKSNIDLPWKGEGGRKDRHQR